MSLKSGLRVTQSLKVIVYSTIQYIAYEFLLAFHSDNGPILYHFGDQAKCWSKVAIFHAPPAFDALVKGKFVGISRKYFVLKTTDRAVRK